MKWLILILLVGAVWYLFSEGLINVDSAVSGVVSMIEGAWAQVRGMLKF